MSSETNDIVKALDIIKSHPVLVDENFQQKLIKVIVEDGRGDFAGQIVDILDIGYFDGALTKLLMGHIKKYVESHNVVPDYETLEWIVKEKEQEGIERERMLGLVGLIKKSEARDIAYVQEYALDFCKKQALKKGLMEAATKWEKGDYENIAKIVNDALRVGEPRNIGHDYIKDVEKRMLRQYRTPVPAMKGVDAKIGGGLAGGELGVLLSPTGGGKSMFLVKFACTALECGKKVVYYTMELNENVIGNRFDACLNQVPLRDVLDYPQVIKERLESIKNLGGGLIIKEFPTGTASVNTLRAHLKALERDNFIPDILFIDYADIMKATSSFTEKRFALTSVYETLRGMAMEMNLPIWTASQASREAINSNSFDLKVISESLGKAQTADIILGVGRTDEDKAQKLATMMVLKNRNGEDGFKIPLYFDTAKIDIKMLDESMAQKVGLMGLTVEQRIRDNAR
jgi:replicative DNA helicase